MQHAFQSLVFIHKQLNQLKLAAYSDTNDLVERSLLGDSMSFQALYERYARAMFNSCLRIVNNVAEAEDILQDAFLDAFRNLRSFQQQSTFGAWLKQIVVNKSINHLKKKKLSLIELDAHEWEIADEPLTEESIDLRVQDIQHAMKQLPNGFRTVLSLYLFEGYDQEEIAGILGVAESTVRTQYMRAKQKLLVLLKQGGTK